MISTLLFWLALGPIYAGIGLLIRRLLSPNETPLNAEVLFLSFWLGWCSVVAGLQVGHFFLPIRAPALVIVGVLGIVGLFCSRRELLNARKRLKTLPTVLTLLAGFWLASHASLPPEHFDTGLYLHSAVQWTTEYPVVKGLGNLHGRLAFNSAFLLYAAMLDPFANGLRSPANGLLLFVLLTWCIHQATHLRRPPHGRSTDLACLFSAFLLGPTLARALGADIFGLSTDLASFVLTAVLSIQLLPFLTGNVSERERLFRWLVLCVTAAATVAVKLSAAAFALVVLAIACFAQRRARNIFLPLASGLVFGIPWILRNVFLSGYLVYPGGWGAVNVDWKIPHVLVLEHTNWIYAWGRQMGAHWSVPLADWSWLGPWWERFPVAYSRLLSVIICGIVVGVVLHALKRWPPAFKGRWQLILLPPVITWTYCFLTAPHPRFSGASFEVLAAGMMALLVIARGHLLQWTVGVILTIFLVGPTALAPPIVLPERPAVQTMVTDSGLEVQVPEGPHALAACWDAANPCTPYFRPGLRLRSPGEVQKGFVLDTEKHFPTLLATPRLGLTASPEFGIAAVSGWRRGDDLAMGSSARLMIYSEKRRNATLILRPDVLRQGEQETWGMLQILHDEKEVSRHALPLQEIELPLSLPPDYSFVTLEVSAGDAQRDPRFRSVIYFRLESVELVVR